jgi:hypothetical protein
MFESALWIAADERIPCRGRMIAHAYREICSMLMGEYSSNSREELNAKLDAFALESGTLNLTSELPTGSSPAPDAPPTAVPASFVTAAAALVRAHTTTDNARSRSRALFEGQARRRGVQPDVGPTSERWFRMQKFFAGHVHDRTTPDREFLEGRFKQEAEFFEETLSMLAEPAVSTLDVLDEILEDANT